MSQFYDLASLVVIPSGYKASTIYAQKPLTTDGQLSFSRASGATRVASNGLIEKVRTNLLTYSQDFSNAAWLVDAGVTKTLSQTDPNGGTTAALFSGTSGSNLTVGHAVTLTANVPNTISIWIKGTASGSVSLRIDDSGVGPQFDINYTTSWQRFSVTKTVDQSSCVFVVGGYFTWLVGESIYLAFGQAETGDIATDYIPTTNAAVSVGPVSNVPRLDYTNSSCPRLLLEPQRTNIVPYSEQLNNAAWTKLETNITANDAVSPDGYTNADKFIANTNNAAHLIYQSVASGTYTFSIYAKAAGENVFSMWLNDFSKRALFDLSSGTVTTSNVTSSSITSVGNGWYRCTVYDTSTTSFVAIYGRNAESYAGNGTSGFLFWGAQCEAGAYATSYIPTLAASVTRVADAASKTGISSLIGQTEGTLFLDANISNLSEARRGIVLYADGNNFITLRISSGNDLQFLVFASSAIQANFTIANPQGNVKMALAYKANDFAAYLNGTLVGSDTSGSVPATSAFYLGHDPGGSLQLAGGINQALLFPTRLTNAQLSELTTL